MSSYYNTLRSTEIRGHVLVSNDTTSGGSSAYLECTGPVQVDGPLTAASVTTPFLAPLGASTYTGDVVLPDVGSPGALSTGSLIQFAGAPFNLTLPAPTAGYLLYFINTDDTLTYTINALGNLNYENPIDTLNVNQSAFVVGLSAWGMLIADGTNWWVIYDSNLLSGISGLGLLTDLNAILSCVITTGPVYNFTSAGNANWTFNGPVTCNDSVTIPNVLTVDTLVVGGGGIASVGGPVFAGTGMTVGGGLTTDDLHVTGSSVTFPAASISPASINTALRFLSGIIIRNDPTTGANGLTFYNGTTNISLYNISGVFTSTSGFSFTNLALSSGLNVTGGSVAFPAASVSPAAINTSTPFVSGLTVQNNSAGTANRFAITDGTTTVFLAAATGALQVSTGILAPTFYLSTTGSQFNNSGINITNTGGASIQTAGGLQAANGLNITGGTVAFPTGSAAQAAIANYGTFTSGVNVTSGTVSVSNTSTTSINTAGGIQAANGINVTAGTVAVSNTSTTSINTAGGIQAANGLNISAGTVSLPAGSIANAALAAQAGMPIAWGRIKIVFTTTGVETAGNFWNTLYSIVTVSSYGLVFAGLGPRFAAGQGGYEILRVTPVGGVSVRGGVATITYPDSSAIPGWTIHTAISTAGTDLDVSVMTGGSSPGVGYFAGFFFIMY